MTEGNYMDCESLYDCQECYGLNANCNLYIHDPKEGICGFYVTFKRQAEQQLELRNLENIESKLK